MTTSEGKTLDARLSSTHQRINQALLGLDWQRGNWLVSPQFYYEHQDPPDYGLDSRSRRFSSLLIRHRTLQDQLEVRAFAAVGLDDSESWLSLRFAYSATDNLELRLHGDRFDSFPGGLFGPLADLTRVGLEVVLRY